MSTHKYDPTKGYGKVPKDRPILNGYTLGDAHQILALGEKHGFDSDLFRGVAHLVLQYDFHTERAVDLYTHEVAPRLTRGHHPHPLDATELTSLREILARAAGHTRRAADINHTLELLVQKNTPGGKQ